MAWHSSEILFFIVLFGVYQQCSTYPVDWNNAGSEEVWGPVVASISLLVACSVIALLGCVCCRHSKTPAFQEFTDTTSSHSLSTAGFVNPLAGVATPASASTEFTIFPPPGVVTSITPSTTILFEPLPDIRPRVEPTPLRPAAFNQSPHTRADLPDGPNFPRDRLKYLQELGKGWFGKVVEGEALVEGSGCERVVVRILHEDAVTSDQTLFLQEVAYLRTVSHKNLLRVLGVCLEAQPLLTIMELCPQGDVKSFLLQHKSEAGVLAQRGDVSRIMCEAAAGLKHLHSSGFVHTDLAARNCLLDSELTLKIGDYGTSIERFRDEYYCVGEVALPIRWCAPETLICTDATIQTREVTVAANVWSLGVVLWEILEFGQLPHADLSDDEVLVQVLGPSKRPLPSPSLALPNSNYLYQVMQLCWRDENDRPSVAQVHAMLLQPQGQGGGEESFEQRWSALRPNTTSEATSLASKHKSPSLQNLHGSLEDLREPRASSLPSSRENLSTPQHRIAEIKLEDITIEIDEVATENIQDFSSRVSIEEDDEDERQINEAIQDLDDALALEKTSSSEHSSTQSTPKRKHTSKHEKQVLDVRLEQSDSEEETTWKKRVERGELTEKVRQKSKSVQDLMVLTHIDSSSEHSDDDTPRPLTAEAFKSEGNICGAVVIEGLLDSFRQLQKLAKIDDVLGIESINDSSLQHSISDSSINNKLNFNSLTSVSNDTDSPSYINNEFLTPNNNISKYLISQKEEQQQSVFNNNSQNISSSNTHHETIISQPVPQFEADEVRAGSISPLEAKSLLNSDDTLLDSSSNSCSVTASTDDSQLTALLNIESLDPLQEDNFDVVSRDSNNLPDFYESSTEVKTTENQPDDFVVEDIESIIVADVQGNVLKSDFILQCESEDKIDEDIMKSETYTSIDYTKSEEDSLSFIQDESAKVNDNTVERENKVLNEELICDVVECIVDEQESSKRESGEESENVNTGDEKMQLEYIDVSDQDRLDKIPGLIYDKSALDVESIKVEVENIIQEAQRTILNQDKASLDMEMITFEIEQILDEAQATILAQEKSSLNMELIKMEIESIFEEAQQKVSTITMEKEEDSPILENQEDKPPIIVVETAEECESKNIETNTPHQEFEIIKTTECSIEDGVESKSSAILSKSDEVNSRSEEISELNKQTESDNSESLSEQAGKPVVLEMIKDIIITEEFADTSQESDSCLENNNSTVEKCCSTADCKEHKSDHLLQLPVKSKVNHVKDPVSMIAFEPPHPKHHSEHRLRKLREKDLEFSKLKCHTSSLNTETVGMIAFAPVVVASCQSQPVTSDVPSNEPLFCNKTMVPVESSLPSVIKEAVVIDPKVTVEESVSEELSTIAFEYVPSPQVNEALILDSDLSPLDSNEITDVSTAASTPNLETIIEKTITIDTIYVPKRLEQLCEEALILDIDESQNPKLIKDSSMEAIILDVDSTNLAEEICKANPILETSDNHGAINRLDDLIRDSVPSENILFRNNSESWSRQDSGKSDDKRTTPDDERSSDSGFRDKGSLSDDTGEKYNLEDIETELETFGQLGTPSSDSGLERTPHDDLKSFDSRDDDEGDEFWKQQMASLQQAAGKTLALFQEAAGTDLSPCDEEKVYADSWFRKTDEESGDNSYVSFNLDDECVAAIRNELQQKLPKLDRQGSDGEVEEDGEMEEEIKREDITIHYNIYPAPLSPILEEQESLASSENGSRTDSPTSFRKHCEKINQEMDSLSSSGSSSPKASPRQSSPRQSSPIATSESPRARSEQFEADIRAALQQCSEQRAMDELARENNEQEEQEEDVLFVNTETNEATLVESPMRAKLPYLAFVNGQKVFTGPPENWVEDEEPAWKLEQPMSPSYLEQFDAVTSFSEPDPEETSTATNTWMSVPTTRAPMPSPEEEQARSRVGETTDTPEWGSDPPPCNTPEWDSEPPPWQAHNTSTPEWESDTASEGSSSSGEFVWREGDRETEVKVEDKGDEEEPQQPTSPCKPFVCEFPMSVIEEEDEDSDSSGAEFVPSSWNSEAAPSRSSLRSPDKKADPKKNVSFKREKYHCVYEYPREASDTEIEDPEARKSIGVSAQQRLDYASYADWDMLEDDMTEPADQDTDPDSSEHTKPEPFDFYKLSSIECDFNNGIHEEGEFFISSSARPFHLNTAFSSQFFPGLGSTESSSVPVSPGGSSSSNNSTTPPSPLSPTMGELRHTRDKLKLDLPKFSLAPITPKSPVADESQA